MTPPRPNHAHGFGLFAVFSPSRPRRVLLNGGLEGGSKAGSRKVVLGRTFGWYLCSGMDDDADSGGDDVIHHPSDCVSSGEDCVCTYQFGFDIR